MLIFSKNAPGLHLTTASSLNNFNFLRLLFASLVLLSHAFELVDGNRSQELLTRFFGTLSFGELAVDGFFLLSGYLIVKSWETHPKPLAFLSKRILRIYPGFVVASLICVFIVGPAGADTTAYFLQLDLKRVLVSMFRLTAPITPPVFGSQPYPVVNGAMWTISYEFACYVAALLLGVFGLVRRKSGWLLVTLTVTLGFVVLTALQKPDLPLLIDGAPESVVITAGFLVRLGMFFCWGGVYYLFRERISFNPRAAWFVATGLFFALFNGATAELALTTFGAYLLFYFAFSSIPLLRRFPELPDISYGLYLYGWPIQKLLLWYFPNLPPGWVFIASMAGGVLAGLLSWFAIEKPFLTLKPGAPGLKTGAAVA